MQFPPAPFRFPCTPAYDVPRTTVRSRVTQSRLRSYFAVLKADRRVGMTHQSTPFRCLASGHGYLFHVLQQRGAMEVAGDDSLQPNQLSFVSPCHRRVWAMLITP
jgi:hypothetical protein